MSPFSTWTANDWRQAVRGLMPWPVFASNSHPCVEQTSAFPASEPSLRGVRKCGQASAKARIEPFTLTNRTGCPSHSTAIISPLQNSSIVATFLGAMLPSHIDSLQGCKVRLIKRHGRIKHDPSVDDLHLVTRLDT